MTQRFVHSRSTYDFRVDEIDEHLLGMLAIALNGEREWRTSVAVWRGIATGASGGIAYLWSARELIILSTSSEREPDVVQFDEDLLQIFHVGDKWLAVCETSLRLLAGNLQLERIELRDVVVTAHWEGNVLVVRDFGGDVVKCAVDGESLLLT